MLAEGAPSSANDALSMPASPSKSTPSQELDDIDALVAWPALEYFMEDLSDLDEPNHASQEALLEQAGDEMRRNDVDLTRGHYLSSRSMLPLTRQLFPAPSYMPWQSLNLPFSRGSVSTPHLGSMSSGSSSIARDLGSCSGCGSSSNSSHLPPQVHATPLRPAPSAPHGRSATHRQPTIHRPANHPILPN